MRFCTESAKNIQNTPRKGPVFGHMDRLRGRKHVFLSDKKKKDLVPKWMSRPKAPPLCEPISTLKVLVCGSSYRLSTNVLRVSI